MRIGFGYDSHRFVEGRTLMLGWCSDPRITRASPDTRMETPSHMPSWTDAPVRGRRRRVISANTFRRTTLEWEGADSMDLLARAVAKSWMSFQVPHLQRGYHCDL